MQIYIYTLFLYNNTVLYEKKIRKITACKICSTLRYAAQKQGHARKIKEQLTAQVFELYNMCTKFDMKIPRQIIRNATAVVKDFQERSDRAPEATKDKIRM